MTKNLPTTANSTITTLAQEYLCTASRLTARIDELRAQIAARPPHEKLCSLEARLDTLRTERRELLASAAHLSRLAAPPPVHPSLLHRTRRTPSAARSAAQERDAS